MTRRSAPSREKKATKKPGDWVDAQVVDGVEGPSLYINNYRVAGPKPWGGGPIRYRFRIALKDIKGSGVVSLLAEAEAEAEAEEEHVDGK